MTHIPPCLARPVMKVAPTPGAADRGEVLNLKQIGPWTHGEKLRLLWCRLRLTVQEMNYATRRLVELQQRLP